jgi:imidazolonepropionase-like amidohydrolase
MIGPQPVLHFLNRDRGVVKKLIALLALGCGTGHVRTVEPMAPVEQGLAFVDVSIVPMDADHVLEHQTVLIRGDRIAALGPAASTRVPDGTTRIDGHGKWLMPGLVDMHVHLDDADDGTLYVANGVTTIRNMWGTPQTLATRADYAAGRALGPTVYTTGPILDGKPPVWPGSLAIENAEEADKELTAEKAAGYDFVKVYSRLGKDAYLGILAAARKYGLRVVGHVPEAVGLDGVLAAGGQESIEHLNGYLMAVQEDHSPALGKPEVGANSRVALAHVDDAKLADIVRRTKAAGVWNCVTLVFFERFAALDDRDALLRLPAVKYVSPEQLADWDPKKDFRMQGMTTKDFATVRALVAFDERVTRALRDAGARLLLGTDTSNPFVIAGFAVHEELALLVEAGLTPFEALRAGTTDAAEFLHTEREFGRVAPGLRADLILVDGNPLADVHNAARASGVVLRGQWLPAVKLEAALDRLAKDRAWPPASATGGGADWFHDAPPLALTGGQVAWRATFNVSFAGTPTGATRLAVEVHKDGRRTIVAQTAARPPRPKLSTLRLEIDPSGHASELTLDEDGKRHGTATASGGKAHFTGDLSGKPVTDEIPMGADDVFDRFDAATLLPIAERAFQLAPGATAVVRGVLVFLAPVASVKPGVKDESYEITRKTDGAHGEHTYDFVDQTPFGKMSGAMVIDTDGHMVSVVYRASYGELKIERSSPPR